MKKILTVFLMVITVSVFAQTKNITGNITDSFGEPLPGVTVVVKGTTTGTATDIDGNYSMADVSSESTIVFSFVGMLTQEMVVGNQTTISLVMENDAIGIEEIVTIGYGTVKKSDLTGSVATVDAKETFAAPSASLDNALQGRAAGVQVSTSSGDPGSTPIIRIRGGNSISAGNTPLYVVDGFVGADNITSINPNDIESMQVLKDASSTAIYGARGANGVILITTKKGKVGKTSVNFKTSFGIKKLPETLDVQNTYEYASWANKIAPDQNNLPWDMSNLPETDSDWQDEIYETGSVQDYQLSISGGSEKATYYLSAGYLSEKGIVRSSGFDRYSLRANIDNKLSKVFKTGLNLSLSRTVKENQKVGSFWSVATAHPLYPIYNEDGSFNGESYYGLNDAQNVVADADMNLDETTTNRALVNTYIQASLFDKVTIKSTFGGDFKFSNRNQFIPSTNPNSIRQNLAAQADINRFDDQVLLNENTINYAETFGDHSLNVMGGATVQAQNRKTVIIEANEIPSDGVTVNSIELAPVENTSINSNYSEYSMLSFLGRVNYSYMGKYLLTATVRRDGSSRLGEDNKWATFPSMALAWNAAKEDFLNDVDVIDVLKLRGSYGVTGNQGISPFTTLATFNTVATANILNGAAVAGVRQGNLNNAGLKWETTSQYDIGVEIGLFERRLSVELDYYYKKTEDLLLAATVPGHTGYTSTMQNVGSLDNRGIELNLNGVIISQRDFSWSASLNISTNKNEVLDLGIKEFITTQSLSGDPASQLRVGYPVGMFWGYVYEGIDPETGDNIYTDISGPDGGGPDGIITSDDKTVIGDATPDFYGGIHTDFKYKNFDLSAFFPFSYGNDIYNLTLYWSGESNINGDNEIRNTMWTAEDPNGALYPSASSASWLQSNSHYVYDGSFLRLGTLQLGYTLPSGLIKGISNCRLYATGTNLFLIKNKDYYGYDPDVSSFTDNTAANSVKRGFENGAYPQNRSVQIGLDITF